MEITEQTYYRWRKEYGGLKNGVISIPGGATGATATRCGTDMSQYDWVQVPLLENEVANPTNSNAVRMKPTIASDLAIEKDFKIERVAITFRAQATNALNHFNLLTSRFDINPNDGANFGTVYPGQTPTADSPPRNIKPQSEGHVLRYGSQGPEPEGWSLHVERELLATRRWCRRL